MQQGGRRKFLESRYALRELEGAIGLDGRTLPDGRRAVFRHTMLHRRIRRDFLERRDLMHFLSMSMLATAAQSSARGINARAAMESMSSDRTSLMRIMFPYLKSDAEDETSDEQRQYDQYFDELDRIAECNADVRGKDNGGRAS